VYAPFAFEIQSLLIGKYTCQIFARNSFETRQVAACRFSKGFCANPGNVSTNRKREITMNGSSAEGVDNL
jgi:hypothetical protein